MFNCAYVIGLLFDIKFSAGWLLASVDLRIATILGPIMDGPLSEVKPEWNWWSP